MKRRQFAKLAAATTVASFSFPGSAWSQVASPSSGKSKTRAPDSDAWLWKTLKIGMIRDGKSLEDKFAIARDAGFLGIELNAPVANVTEANKAAAATGLIIDGTVGGYHWKIRHTDPDPDVRMQALTMLRDGLRTTASLGADTMLLVPGRGTDGDKQVVHDRAIAAIESALPLSEDTGVRILIENVWNDMFYDKDGGTEQTADELAAFVDHFDSPMVGVQFDIGNHWKYGDPAGWIRTLGDRILKLDVKGFSRQSGAFTAITEGDIDWASVRKALRDIRFQGWLAAEVSGGDGEKLSKVGTQMESALHCSQPVA